ncbi:MAG TPA: hypothetical protein VGI79_06120 [Caulobacteraceae bacterium]|jgi:hypothetical protein
MTGDLYTFICDFHGATYVSQVRAEGVSAAVREWARRIKADKPIPRSSAFVASSVLKDLAKDPPTPLDGLEGVWCFTAFVSGDLLLGNIIRSK